MKGGWYRIWSIIHTTQSQRRKEFYFPVRFIITCSKKKLMQFRTYWSRERKWSFNCQMENEYIFCYLVYGNLLQTSKPYEIKVIKSFFFRSKCKFFTKIVKTSRTGSPLGHCLKIPPSVNIPHKNNSFSFSTHSTAQQSVCRKFWDQALVWK